MNKQTELFYNSFQCKSKELLYKHKVGDITFDIPLCRFKVFNFFFQKN